MSVPQSHPLDPSRLDRRLGTVDAVVIGLGSMIGAGIFTVLSPAAAVAGFGLLIGLAIAAGVAFCNATSSAQLAARYPESGGSYVYGRERLGAGWGYLAGWSFVVGKTASCAAMALTFGSYIGTGSTRLLAAGAVIALTSVNLLGVQKSAWLTRVLVAVVLVVLVVVVVVGLMSISPVADRDTSVRGGVGGVLEAAALLFFAFAGYARIATLGEEVRDPRRTIPRAIPIALGITLAVYLVVSVTALVSVGPTGLAASATPLLEVAELGPDGAVAIVRVGAAVGSLGVLMSLLLGVSRTGFAMASGGDLPRWLAAVHPRRRVPHHAELAVALVVVVVVLVADVRDAIGFSSFTVLTYYAIANAASWTLSPAERRWPRVVSAVGLVSCIVLAFSLPPASLLLGIGVLALGAVIWFARRGRIGGPPARA